MYKIILVHLAIFAALFGLAMPGLNNMVGDAVNFEGGMLAVVVMTVLSEVVVVAGGMLSRIVGNVLGINPLLQRKKSEGVSITLLTLLYAGFLVAASAIVPSVISVTWLSALLVSVAVNVVLFAALYIKRAIIASQP